MSNTSVVTPQNSKCHERVRSKVSGYETALTGVYHESRGIQSKSAIYPSVRIESQNSTSELYEAKPKGQLPTGNAGYPRLINLFSDRLSEM